MMMFSTCLALLLLLARTSFTLKVPYKSGDQLPIIDLGYERHQALTFDSTTSIYTFSNIRYAAPPIGSFRFAAPSFPSLDREIIQNGSEPRVCPQAQPEWQGKAYDPIVKYTNPKNKFTLDGWVEDYKNAEPRAFPEDEVAEKLGVTEDCLFLDVYVPKRVLEKTKQKGFKGVPVLFWIHGGGYVLSSKVGYPVPSFYPDNLLDQSKNQQDMIFVAINYRLGALGFLSGPDVTSNVGILDQRFALEWVQEHIHKFGGDKKRVTVMGQSAGGGSSLIHVAAFGGHHSTSKPLVRGGLSQMSGKGLSGNKQKKLFHQVIAQSPAFVPSGVPPQSAYKDFLQQMGVKNIAEARKLDSRTVMAANTAMIGAAPPNTAIFAPVVDGDLIPDNLATLFAQGRFDKTIHILAGHNSFESGFFFDTSIETDAEFEEWVDTLIPGLSEEHMKELTEQLYPPVYDGNYEWKDQATRQMALSGEAIFNCHFNVLQKANRGRNHGYVFEVSPGIHIQDLAYTFDNRAVGVPYPAAKAAMQSMIGSFVKTGKPVFSAGANFPKMGKDGQVIRIREEGAVLGRNELNQTRCDWWASL